MNVVASALYMLLTFIQLSTMDVPSEREQLGLEILITIAVAVGDCENVQSNPSRVESTAANYGVKQADVSNKYKVFSKDYASDLMKAADANPVNFCIYALRTFGPQGSIPGLIVLK